MEQRADELDLLLVALRELLELRVALVPELEARNQRSAAGRTAAGERPLISARKRSCSSTFIFR